MIKETDTECSRKLADSFGMDVNSADQLTITFNQSGQDIFCQLECLASNGRYRSLAISTDETGERQIEKIESERALSEFQRAISKSVDMAFNLPSEPVATKGKLIVFPDGSVESLVFHWVESSNEFTLAERKNLDKGAAAYLAEIADRMFSSLDILKG